MECETSNYDEIINGCNELLEKSIESENYEISQDIKNMIDALKTNDADTVKKEIAKYNIEKFEYNGFYVRQIYYRGVYTGAVQTMDYDIIYSTYDDNKESVINSCQKFIDYLLGDFLDLINDEF